MIRVVRLYRRLMAWGYLREGEKRFRSDIGMWEQEKFFFGKWFYVYSIREGDTLRTKRTITKIKGEKYVPFVRLPEIEIGTAEMKERYGNKWSVPTNINYNPLYE